MLSNSIRKNFLQFFKNKQHTISSSSPVFPINDPSLLFTNAGMNQFKDFFLGKEIPPYPRTSTSQKCIRAGGKHNDLENVGHTSRHLTFFEMLGNFSFGDYFKKEAINFAWEISVSIFNFDPSKIWASVYEEDEESFALWEAYLPTNRIVRLGSKDNFWSMGDIGPCGPCSELLYDRGPEYSSASNPAEDLEGERFLEYWNLVFMQFNKTTEGTLVPLPKSSVDTGAGLERLVSIINNSSSVFNTDILRHIISKIETISHKSYNNSNPYEQPAFRVISDHIRSLAFAISDGLLPGNTDRGYVLRKIIRRAVNYGRRLGFNTPFLSEVLPALIEGMGEAYPQLNLSKDQITSVLFTEEENYFKTLKKGGHLWKTIINHSENSGTISDQDAFKLKDTYGLPLEEILLLAKDHHISVDIEGFYKLEEEAKIRSKNANKTKYDSSIFTFEKLAQQGLSSSFTGYDQTNSEALILSCLQNNEPVSQLNKGDTGYIILNKTPFFAEKGGQIGDKGIIKNHQGVFKVIDTYSPYNNIIVHQGTMLEGTLYPNSNVLAEVNIKVRKQIANNHTATHLLQWAIRKVLSPQSHQAGSIVADSYLRFDFNYPNALTKEQLLTIESLINEKIRENHPVFIYELSYEKASKQPDIIQFFGDKYGNVVRVVDINFSKELCGGIHAHSTGDLGIFLITKEFSVSTGIRRIEAKTGSFAEQDINFNRNLISNISSELNSPIIDLETKITSLIEENKSLKLHLNQLSNSIIQKEIQQLLSLSKVFHNIPIVIYNLSNITNEKFRLYSEVLNSINLNALVFLYGTSQNKNVILVHSAKTLQKQGILANKILQDLFSIKKGKGGGKIHLAQGTSPEAFNDTEITSFIQTWITNHLN